MKLTKPFALLGLIFLTFVSLNAQDAALSQRMKNHVVYLADDKLEGREAGTEGERLAADYLSKQFAEMGLKPAGTGGNYTQPFEFLKGRVMGMGTFCKVDGESWKMPENWAPTIYSGSGDGNWKIASVGFGIVSPEQKHDDYAAAGDVAGKALVMELGSPDGVHPHSKFKGQSDINTKLKLAMDKGAAAVIFVNNDPNLSNPETDLTKKATPYAIPVLFFPGKKSEDLNGKSLSLNLTLTEEMGNGMNVAALLDNGAKKTVVIGGHFDHLGWGESSSLHRGESAIHNGADDNASGTAMVLEIARTLKQTPEQGVNYLFLCFSGEEKGLLGSNYWVKNPTLPLADILCMINFDMVGRLNATEQTIAISGTGTSPFWEEQLGKIKAGNLKQKTSGSGVGPSDHTSFYLQNIPVLHFFTGTHEDYHKPSDDEEKVNYDGMVRVHAFVMDLIGRIENEGEMTFTKTQDAESGKAPKFSVTLGVVPDYMYSGEGMKIDGVSDGKPAQKAGLQGGDVIIQLGEIKIIDMRSYMTALSQFEKGQKTTVIFLREGKKVKKKILF